MPRQQACKLEIERAAADAQRLGCRAQQQAGDDHRLTTMLQRLHRGAFPEKHRHQGLIEAGDRLFALLEARLGNGDEGPPFRAVGCWAFVHGLAMLALDDQLRLHRPGTDDDTLLAVLRPMVDTYARN